MINQLRTTLLNVAGSALPDYSVPGEEYVDPSFVPAVHTQATQAVYRVLFGHDPDRLMLNYRLWQLLAMLHNTELRQFVYAADPRITYWPPGVNNTFIGVFGTSIAQRSGAPNTLFMSGDITAARAGGRLTYQWQLRLQDVNRATLQQYRPFPSTTLLMFPFTGGTAGPIPLAGSVLSVSCRNPQPGQTWYIAATLQPELDLGVVAKQLEHVGDANLVNLFGTSGQEPWNTWQNLWNGHPQLGYKLGGLVLALAARLNMQPRVSPAVVSPVPAAATIPANSYGNGSGGFYGDGVDYYVNS